MLTQLERSSLQDLAYDRLRQAIGRAELAPGERFSLKDLAQRLGVSTMPVREALRRLEAEGLLIFERGRGIVVSSLTAADVREMFAIRRRLEPWATSLAASRMTGETLTELGGFVESLERARGSPDEWRDLNRAFHLRIYEAAGVRRLERLIMPLLDAVEPYLRLYVNAVTSLDHAQRQHRDLLGALRAKDAAGAEALTDAHLADTARVLERLLVGVDRRASPSQARNGADEHRAPD